MGQITIPMTIKYIDDTPPAYWTLSSSMTFSIANTAGDVNVTYNAHIESIDSNMTNYITSNIPWGMAPSIHNLMSFSSINKTKTYSGWNLSSGPILLTKSSVYGKSFSYYPGDGGEWICGSQGIGQAMDYFPDPFSLPDVLWDNPPSAPAYVNYPTTVSAGTNIIVSWGQSTDIDGDSITYDLLCSYNNGAEFPFVKDLTVTSQSVYIPSNWTKAYFRVVAKSKTLQASTSGPIMTIINNNPPNAPTSITVPASAAAKSTINVYWDSPNQSIYGQYNVNNTYTEDTGHYPNYSLAFSAGTYIYSSYNSGAGEAYGISPTYKTVQDYANEGNLQGMVGQYTVYDGTSGATVALITEVRDQQVPQYGWIAMGTGTLVYQSTKSQVKGSYIGDVTAPYNTYPNDGISGGYWYTYKGTSPSVDVDGDTISYKLEFYNGSSWSICGTTTAVNMNYTLPDIEITTAKFRVTATDSRGGTSGTITSGNFTIFKLQMYVNIGGISKRVLKAYVQVNGVLKQVNAIYTKKDGIIKR